MIKRKSAYHFIFCLLLAVSFASCGNNSKELANEYCDCLKKSGLDKKNESRGFPNLNLTSECVKDITRRMYEILKPMSNDQRADYLHEFANNMLDTECGEWLFEKFPYDDMLKSMERELGKDDKEYFSMVPSVCDCIEGMENMQKEFKEAGDDKNKKDEIEKKYESLQDACEKLSEGMSDEDKDKLIEEAKKCR